MSIREARDLIEACAARAADEDTEPVRIEAEERDGHLAVSYEGIAFADSEGFASLLGVLRSEPVRGHLGELRLSGPDEGANGTREWDLRDLLRDDEGEYTVRYPALRVIDMELTLPGHHNHTISGHLLEEDHQAAAILDACPALEELTVASAPSGRFFERPSHPLRRLTVVTGYEPVGFVRGLAGARCFPGLEALDFTDSELVYMAREEYQKSRTPRADLEALFASGTLPSLRQLTLRGTVLRPSDLPALRGTRLGRSLTRLELIRGVAIDWTPDEQVFARWEDDYWYPAHVTGHGERGLSVLFDDGTESPDHRASDVRAVPLLPGTPVEARWQGGEDYFPAIVTGATDAAMVVQYEDGATEPVPPQWLRIARLSGRP